jgi:hypothetical protein
MGFHTGGAGVRSRPTGGIPGSKGVCFLMWTHWSTAVLRGGCRGPSPAWWGPCPSPGAGVGEEILGQWSLDFLLVIQSRLCFLVCKHIYFFNLLFGIVAFLQNFIFSLF